MASNSITPQKHPEKAVYKATAFGERKATPDSARLLQIAIQNTSRLLNTYRNMKFSLFLTVVFFVITALVNIVTADPEPAPLPPGGFGGLGKKGFGGGFGGKGGFGKKGFGGGFGGKGKGFGKKGFGGGFGGKGKGFGKKGGFGGFGVL